MLAEQSNEPVQSTGTLMLVDPQLEVHSRHGPVISIATIVEAAKL